MPDPFGRVALSVITSNSRVSTPTSRTVPVLSPWPVLTS